MKGTAYTAAARETRAKIIASARALYLEQGYDGLVMRRIAERAGLGTMTTYRHFANKEALLAEIAAEGFELFARYFYRALEGSTAEQRLWLCGEHFLSFALDHPRYYHAMFAADVPAADGAAKLAAAHHFLADRVRELSAAPDDVNATALGLFALCHGVVALHLARRYEPNVDLPGLFRRTLLRSLRGLGLVPSTFEPIEVS
jgi:AcrR family transcriptional regulator